MSGFDAARLARDLAEHGYCIVRDLLPRATVAALEADVDETFAATPFGEGHFYGFRTKRFGSLLRRSPHAAALALEPTILGAVNAILGAGCERIQLNVAQAIEIHPGEQRQFPHCDHDMWAGAKGAHEYLVNVLWPLTPFRADNGATHIYPGTHRHPPSSLDELGDPVIAECEPGSAICVLGSTVHGAGANVTSSVRRAVVIGYSLGWLKPYENLWLAYPPDVARHFSPDLAELAGYAQHRPNLGNYEGQCPSVLLCENAPEHLAAVDGLRPDQADLLAQFAMAERNGHESSTRP